MTENETGSVHVVELTEEQERDVQAEAAAEGISASEVLLRRAMRSHEEALLLTEIADTLALIAAADTSVLIEQGEQIGERLHRLSAALESRYPEGV